MYKHFALFALACCLCMSCTRCTSDPEVNNDPNVENPADEPTTFVTPLKVIGKQLCNVNEKPIALHGVSLGWHNWWPQFYNAGVVSTLKNDWKATVVRAAMGVEPDGAYLSNPEEAKAHVMRVVDAAIENDMYVIIDWHAHELNLSEAKSFFVEMATKYKDVPNVIYELFNEPVDESWPQIKAYSQKLITAIRAIDSNALILVSAPRWSQNLDEVANNPIEGESNIMYVLHFYAGTHKQDLRAKADYALSKGLPVFVSECASMEASGDGPIDEVSWEEWRKWMVKNRLSWVMWSVTDKEETCSMIVPGGSATGAWTDDELKPWGKMVRSVLRND